MNSAPEPLDPANQARHPGLNYEEARQLVSRCVLNESAEENQRQLLEMAQRLYPEIL